MGTKTTGDVRTCVVTDRELTRSRGNRRHISKWTNERKITQYLVLKWFRTFVYKLITASEAERLKKKIWSQYNSHFELVYSMSFIFIHRVQTLYAYLLVWAFCRSFVFCDHKVHALEGGIPTVGNICGRVCVQVCPLWHGEWRDAM